MKIVKYCCAFLLFGSLFMACTDDETVEAAMATEQPVLFNETGEDDNGDPDNDKDG